MPIFDRPLIADRPTLIDPVVGAEEDEPSASEQPEKENGDAQTSRASVNRVEKRGEGGGPLVNGVEFEEDSDELIKSSNLIAVLATGEEQGEVFTQIFKNASYHLAEVQEQGHDITDLTTLSEELNTASVGAEELFEESEEETEETMSEEDDGEEESLDDMFEDTEDDEETSEE